MQFTVAAVLALAASVSASYPSYSNGTVSYTTEVHTAYTTVCPEATTLSFNGVTYTVSESTTLTITNCPCTVVKPVTTSSVVYPTSAPPAPVYANSTAPAAPPATSAPATSAPAKSSPTYVPANGANQAIAFSGASLVGLLGLAAYIL